MAMIGPTPERDGAAWKVVDSASQSVCIADWETDPTLQDYVVCCLNPFRAFLKSTFVVTVVTWRCKVTHFQRWIETDSLRLGYAEPLFRGSADLVKKA